MASKELEMFDASMKNFQIFKDHIPHHFGRYVSRVSIVLKQLDKTHFHIENGVDPCIYTFQVVNDKNKWSFPVCSYEADDIQHTFRFRPDTVIVGKIDIVLKDGSAMTAFDIEPFNVARDMKGGSVQLKGLYCYNNAPDTPSPCIPINLTFDSNNRIKTFHIGDINIDDYSHAQKLIVKMVSNGYEYDHIKNTLESMNKLSFKKIIKN